MILISRKDRQGRWSWSFWWSRSPLVIFDLWSLCWTNWSCHEITILIFDFWSFCVQRSKIKIKYQCYSDNLWPFWLNLSNNSPIFMTWVLILAPTYSLLILIFDLLSLKNQDQDQRSRSMILIFDLLVDLDQCTWSLIFLIFDLDHWQWSWSLI